MGFQKTDFGVSYAKGVGNTKIGFIITKTSKDFVIMLIALVQALVKILQALAHDPKMLTKNQMLIIATLKDSYLQLYSSQVKSIDSTYID